MRAVASRDSTPLVFTLRCTAKLLKRLETRPNPSPPSSTTRLGDWYANLLYVHRRPLFLCVSEVTLLPVVVGARGSEQLATRLAASLGEVLTALGVSEAAIREEQAAMSQITIAATANRTVLGSMNDFQRMLPADWDPPEALPNAALRLSEAPCGPLKMASPRDVAVARLSGQ